MSSRLRWAMPKRRDGEVRRQRRWRSGGQQKNSDSSGPIRCAINSPIPANHVFFTSSLPDAADDCNGRPKRGPVVVGAPRLCASLAAQHDSSRIHGLNAQGILSPCPIRAAPEMVWMLSVKPACLPETELDSCRSPRVPISSGFSNRAHPRR